MRRLFFSGIILLLFSTNCKAQSTENERISEKDSLNILSELMGLLDSVQKPTSYLMITAGVGNRYFSVRNNLLKAKQTNSAKLVVTPSVGYFNKSGFNVTASANILNNGSGVGFSQFSLTPAFDLQRNPNFALSVSYTRYFVEDYYSAYSSPVQNDCFASFSYKKPYLEPGIAFGYSTGKYNETYYWKNRNGLKRYDSVSNQLRTASAMLFAGHHYYFFECLHKKDALIFFPTLVLNAGSSKIIPSNKTNATLAEIARLNKTRRFPKIQNTSFSVESFGMNADLNYALNWFTLGANVYADYYLPSSVSNRLSVTFSINLGVSF